MFCEYVCGDCQEHVTVTFDKNNCHCCNDPIHCNGVKGNDLVLLCGACIQCTSCQKLVEKNTEHQPHRCYVCFHDVCMECAMDCEGCWASICKDCVNYCIVCKTEICKSCNNDGFCGSCFDVVVEN